MLIERRDGMYMGVSASAACARFPLPNHQG